MLPNVSYSSTAQSTQTIGHSFLNEIIAGRLANVCISPISIGLCLQLALYGARGSTEAEMLKVLGIAVCDREMLAADAELLIRKLQTIPTDSNFDGPGAVLKLAIANSIWVHGALRLNGNYANTLQSKYASMCNSLDFSDPKSLSIINSWVDQNTEHKIQNIVSELQPNDMLVLINCAYFKARWKRQFRPENTEMRNFHLPDNTSVQVPIMHLHEASLLYFQDETVQIVQLNYTDERFSMYVVLPAPGANLSMFVSKLTVEQWQSWFSQLKEHQGLFALPKFKIEFSIELNGVLMKLGMVNSFSGSADFYNMIETTQGSPPRFCIGTVIHKTFIAVDEQGTEAAAATAIVPRGLRDSPPPPPPFRMIVDRPFVYAVRDNMTGTILFLGTVVDPRN